MKKPGISLNVFKIQTTYNFFYIVTLKFFFNAVQLVCITTRVGALLPENVGMLFFLQIL